MHFLRKLMNNIFLICNELR